MVELLGSNDTLAKNFAIHTLIKVLMYLSYLVPNTQCYTVTMASYFILIHGYFVGSNF